jgi:hypothetical protein
MSCPPPTVWNCDIKWCKILDNTVKKELAIMKYIQRVLRNITGHRIGRFPGAHPISFTRERLYHLRRNTYMVAEKTDGIRFLMYASHKAGVFFINRSFLFIACQIDMQLPDETILDGEMIYENNKYVYYAFDALCYNRVQITDLPLLDRLRVVHNFIRAIRSSTMLQVKLKAMYPLKNTSYLFTNVIPALSHVSDGLIFTPMTQGYEGPIPILKWKPSFLNSVDFRIRNGKCYLNDRSEPVADIEEKRDIVGECVWRAGRWVLERVRDDKGHGNSFAVYSDIVNDLKHPLTVQELILYITHLDNTLQ